MNDFIAQIKDGAIAAQKRYGVPASLTIAQAILESGWGKYSVGNNIFGIKASPSWTGRTVTCKTGEVYGGKPVMTSGTFRAYDSVEDSIADHARLFAANSCYHNIIGCTDYRQACRNVQADGYATDPHYADQLIAIIEENSLQRFDTAPVVPVKPLQQRTLMTGSRIQYTGPVYADSYGGGRGKTVSGEFTVDRYIQGRKYGAHIPQGWIDVGPAHLL